MPIVVFFSGVDLNPHLVESRFVLVTSSQQKRAVCSSDIVGSAIALVDHPSTISPLRDVGTTEVSVRVVIMDKPISILTALTKEVSRFTGRSGNFSVAHEGLRSRGTIGVVVTLMKGIVRVS